MPEVDFENQAPVFKVSTGNNVNQVPTGDTSPSTAVPGEVHTGIAVPESPAPPHITSAQ